MRGSLTANTEARGLFCKLSVCVRGRKQWTGREKVMSMTLSESKDTKLFGGANLEKVSKKTAYYCFSCVHGNRTVCTFFINKHDCTKDTSDLYHLFLFLKKTNQHDPEYGLTAWAKGAKII